MNNKNQSYNIKIYVKTPILEKIMQLRTMREKLTTFKIITFTLVFSSNPQSQ